MSVNTLPSDRAAVAAAPLSPLSEGSTGTTGWADASKFRRFMAVIMAGVEGSSATVDAKLQQATSSGGAGAKDVPNSSITQFLKASDDNKEAIINFDTANIDVANGFRFVRLSITGGTAASLVAGLLLGFDPFNGPAAQDASVVQIVSC